MIIVLPVCAKDIHLAISNLEWCLELDGKTPFHCLIVHERDFDVSALESLASQYFLSVKHLTYLTLKGDLRWPRVPNHVWRTVARHFSEHINEPWFWWESDAVPVQKDWLSSLAAEYEQCGKPFMGAWTTFGGHGYMPGVGFYPARVPSFSVNCFLTDDFPWDRILGLNINNKIHVINHLLCHTIEPVDFKDWKTVKAHITGTTLLFHKCKNLSLVERFREQSKRGKKSLFAKLTGAVLPHALHTAVIVYVPPPHVPGAAAFIKNIQDFPPYYPLYLLSDYAWPKAIPVPDPTKEANSKHKNKLATIIFFSALDCAKAHGITHFLYLEADCRVKGDDWDKKLFDQYFNEKMVIAGALAMTGVSQAGLQAEAKFRELVIWHNDGKTWPVCEQAPDGQLGSVLFVNGAPAIYETQLVDELVTKEGRSNAIQNWKAYDYDIGRLACNKWGLVEAFDKILMLPGILSTEGDRLLPFDSKIGELSNGNAYAVHSIKTNWRPIRDIPSFYMSGDLGDIIYGLNAVRAFGGGRIILGPEYHGSAPPRCPINHDNFEALRPIIEKQSYCLAYEFSTGYPMPDYDLNTFRTDWNNVAIRRDTGINNLSEMMFRTVGLEPLWDSSKTWLTIPEAQTVSPVIVHRSSRYHEPGFDWKRIVEKFKTQMVFIGLFDEYQQFIREFGYISFFQVESLYHMATIIKGAKWLIGNQSFPMSLAIAMGQNVYQETCRRAPDCIYKRPNFHNQEEPIEVISWT